MKSKTISLPQNEEMGQKNNSYLRGKELRDILMKRYGNRCFWCDKIVNINEELYPAKQKRSLPDDTATIEHLSDYSRGHKKPDPLGKYKVLSCYRCNIDRGNRIGVKIEDAIKTRIKEIKRQERTALIKEFENIIEDVLKDVEFRLIDNRIYPFDEKFKIMKEDMQIVRHNLRNKLQKLK